MKISISSLWKELNIEDQVSLVMQLYDAYNDKPAVVEIVLNNSSKAKKYIECNSTVSGIKDRGTIDAFQIYKVLTPVLPDKIPTRDKSLDIDIFDMMVDWQALTDYAGILHDQEATSPYGLNKQKIILREIILKLKTYYQSPEFPISEKVLGCYSPLKKSVKNIRGDNSPDRYIQFTEALKGLQKDGFIEIVDLLFNFSAELIEDQNREYDFIHRIGFKSTFFNYLPAEHCQAVIRIKSNLTPLSSIKTEKIKGEENKEIKLFKEKQTIENNLDKLTEIPITTDWKVIEKETEADVVYKNKVVHTFEKIDTDTYKYFRFLANNYGKRIRFEEMGKVGKQVEYTANKKRYQISKDVVSKVKYLKNVLAKAKLKKININTKGFFRLTIK